MRRDVTRGARTPRPQGRGLAIAVLPLLLALAPSPLRAQASNPDTVRLVWTAPGDDGQIGTATAYEMRSSTSPIDNANWSAATVVTGVPAPLPAGSPHRTMVRGLTFGTTYYFAIRSVDDVGNWSGLSNLLRWDWNYSTVAPAAPIGLSAARLAGGDVRASWSPNGEADLAGYSLYRALAAGGPFVALNGALLSATEYVDGTIPTGTETVWYQVTASDASGNESARSSTFSLSLVAEVTAWAMEPGYPNPSGAGAIVRIPLVVPTAGGDARIEIVNSAGQRVRILDLGTLAAGTPVMQWDGRNEGGREVAAGVYTAWLMAGSTRTAIRLLRVP